jgi:hypothetical protein
LSQCGQIGSLVAAKAIETVGPSITEDRMEEIRQWLADLNVRR